MIRVLADENVPLPSIRLLREAGLDIEAVAEFAAGTADAQVLAYAKEQGQIVVTFDRDFGELSYRRGAPVPAGVVYLRVTARGPEDAGRVLLDLLKLEGVVLTGHFTVVERERIRQRPLLEMI